MDPRTTVAAVISLAATGTAGLALLVAYFLVRRFQRRRGRVWSVPLGGYFPLTATIVSVAVAYGILMLQTTRVVTGPGVSLIAYAAVGLVVTYGGRMTRMLRQQARDRGQLA